MKERSGSFIPDKYEYDDPSVNPPNLDRFYSSLHNYVGMVVGGYTKLLMLDAKGGLGKTYNVKKVLTEELKPSEWSHQKGFTTPLELYKTLYMAQQEGHVLFLDDMSGVTNNQKAIDMLKAATDTEGEENWVEYRTSKEIEHPDPNVVRPLPNTFCFRGAVIMSFNETPDNAHFNALKDRGTFYRLDFDYETRIDLIREVAKIEGFSDLDVTVQQETAEWVNIVTDRSIEVSIRTFENILEMRAYGEAEGKDWEMMALDVFDLNYDKYLIVRLMDETEYTVGEQIEIFEQKTGRSRSHYYNLKNEIVSERLE